MPDLAEAVLVPHASAAGPRQQPCCIRAAAVAAERRQGQTAESSSLDSLALRHSSNGSTGSCCSGSLPTPAARRRIRWLAAPLAGRLRSQGGRCQHV